ncbi:MAG: glycerol-3-phosphate 1-O-acyltransferase PlsY [Acidimicrobiia bacterium]|nr:glycerol-3-phosphate 1-O-acyltransferase PlsY [Acidimicrobiia bacterium]
MEPTAIAAVVAGYLIGSIDFGVIIPRMRGVDIYSHGSGNPGTTNVLRTMGRKTAVFVMAGDMTKGFAAAVIGDLTGTEAVGFAAGFAAVLGHCFPIWHRFRGGKGVATAGGMMLWLEPILGVGLLAVWVLLAFAAKRASIASLVVAAALVPGVLASGHRGWPVVWSAAAATLVVVRHHENVRRLLRGAERRIAA